MPTRRLLRSFLVGSFLTLGAVASGTAGAADAPVALAAPAPVAVEVPAQVLAGLANHAASFEQMKLRGAYTFDGKIEELDGSGNPSDTKEIQMKVVPRRESPVPLVDVIRYLENGTDKTSEAREKAAKRKPKKDKKEMHLPFLASEQPRYVFSLAERDPQHPSRIRVSFVPKEPAEDAFKGSAWVDTTTNNVLSVGFSLSKNPTFVDHVDVQITFGLSTAMGRAPSEISFDGRGGFLFVHKHYRGKATITNARLAY